MKNYTKKRYQYKYKDYQRVNTLSGWATHLKLVLISMFVK